MKNSYCWKFQKQYPGDIQNSQETTYAGVIF